MGMDLGALKDVQKGLISKTEGGDLIFYAKNIGEETDVRLLPNFANMNGLYFLETIVWWIGGKKYLSPETWGEACPMQDLADEARESGDEDLIALLEDKDKCKKSSEFIMPILLLKPTYDGEVIIDFSIVDGKAKILSCGPMLMKRMNKIVTSRQVQNGTPDGIADRVKGYNLILSKTGKALKTEYDAVLGDQWEFDEKFYKTYPNVVDLSKKQQRPDEYLEGVMANYLYGDPMPEDPIKEERENAKAPAAKPASRIAEKAETLRGGRAAAAPASRRPAAAPKPDEDDTNYEGGDDDTPADELPKEEPKAPATRTSRTAPKPEADKPAPVAERKAATRPARNLISDLDNLD